MIEFVPGPHGENVTAAEKKLIKELLENCWNPEHFGNHVNIVYNNTHHFASPQYDYDIRSFLKELKSLVDSQYHVVQVMGSVHSDPLGHSSMMIGQYSHMGEFYPCLVKDSYIRFKIINNPKYMKGLNVFNDASIFHFLVQVPQVVKAQLGRKAPLVMFQLIGMNGEQLQYPGIFPITKQKIMIQA
jgi:hypothetical protein